MQYDKIQFDKKRRVQKEIARQWNSEKKVYTGQETVIKSSIKNRRKKNRK